MTSASSVMTSAPTLESFSKMQDSPQKFRNAVGQYLEAIGELTAKTTELVESGQITPLQGLGIIGCASSQIYAVGAFHGGPSLADVWSTDLSGSSRSN